MTEAMVRLEGVSKHYGPVIALAEIDLAVRKGEFMTLLGPSGSGKTTLLNLLSGTVPASAGRIIIDGRDVTDLPSSQRGLGMVFQSYALFPHMTVFKNLAFGPTVRRLGRAEREATVKQVAQSLGLESLLDRRPDQLSGGQRQRVALGRALVRQPKIFLLDEPLSNLDAALRVQMRSELIRLHREWQVTTIYVTHDQVEALTMGDRIAVFDQGNLLQIATPSELYDAPQNRFVAEFIGSPKMNVFPAKVTDVRQNGFAVHCLGETISAEGRTPGEGLVKGTSVSVGIRPHDLHLAVEAPPRCTKQLKVTVDLMENAGSEIFVEVTAASGTRIMARIHRSTRVSPGDHIILALDPADLHLFAADTGDTLLAGRVSPEQPVEMPQAMKTQ